jgi:hypothetical protein
MTTRRAKFSTDWPLDRVGVEHAATVEYIACISRIFYLTMPSLPVGLAPLFSAGLVRGA